MYIYGGRLYSITFIDHHEYGDVECLYNVKPSTHMLSIMFHSSKINSRYVGLKCSHTSHSDR